MIARLLSTLGLLPFAVLPPQPSPAARAAGISEATRAARTLNARRRDLRRQAIATHLATFGPFARGLDILKEHPAND